LCTRRRTQGANLPSLSRALVACAWFGIQTFIGGSSLHEMLLAAGGGGGAALGLPAQPLAALGGITGAQLACFLAFWALQVAIVVRGIDTIKAVETCSAPILVALSAALLLWALGAAGGWGPMLAAPSQVCACVCVCGGVRVCVCVCVCVCVLWHRCMQGGAHATDAAHAGARVCPNPARRTRAHNGHLHM
jgi:cytosine/uracil/thiamine/allantoin permease